MDEINLAIIFDAISEPAFLLDSNRRILNSSAAATDMFGELQGQDFARAIRNPEALACVDKTLKTENNQETNKRQTTITLASPHRTTFRISAVKLASHSSQSTYVMVSLHDISHILEAEQMRSDFVANVSHELRSPLTTLTGLIETLQTVAKDDEEAREKFLGIMANESERMTRIISDLLSLSKVEENERLRPIEMIDVDALLKRTIASIAPRLETENKNIKIRSDLPNCLVPGDEDQLTQVFHNLIENAAKYSHKETTITIEIKRDIVATGFNHPVCTVSINDVGEGIAPEHIVRLTERFYRVDKGRSRQMGGTGLGLAIVKHILNRHRGRLTIDSTVGKGSTFTVLLPQQV